MTNYKTHNKFFILIKILFIYLIFSSKPFAGENDKFKNITEGNLNAKIEIIVYESLTCSHCANFHKKVYPDLKKIL
tara:strand:+ start:26 stop:253 length:228 start_codon:yes stop_codon:yes gene_type:complete